MISYGRFDLPVAVDEDTGGGRPPPACGRIASVRPRPRCVVPVTCRGRITRRDLLRLRRMAQGKRYRFAIRSASRRVSLLAPTAYNPIKRVSRATVARRCPRGPRDDDVCMRDACATCEWETSKFQICTHIHSLHIACIAATATQVYAESKIYGLTARGMPDLPCPLPRSLTTTSIPRLLKHLRARRCRPSATGCPQRCDFLPP